MDNLRSVLKVFYLWIILILNQVRCIEKLLTHLPVAGCRYCIGANPRKKFGVSDRCICDDLFLTPLPSLHWRASHITWYGRERRGENWFKSIIETISMYAGLSQRYTNSFCRPSSITALSHAEYSNREIAEFTGQKNPTIIEQYKKQVKMLTPEAKQKQNNPHSGRNYQNNPFSEKSLELPSSNNWNFENISALFAA